MKICHTEIFRISWWNIYDEIFLTGELGATLQRKPDNTSGSISESCWPDCAEQSIKIVQVGRGGRRDIWLIRSEMIALLGQTSPGETSLGLQARLREGEHVRGRVYDGCQLETGRVLLWPSSKQRFIQMAQVLGKKFKKLSWTKFVDMIINNELSLHNEFGEYHWDLSNWILLYFPDPSSPWGSQDYHGLQDE